MEQLGIKGLVELVQSMMTISHEEVVASKRVVIDQLYQKVDEELHTIRVYASNFNFMRMTHMMNSLRWST